MSYKEGWKFILDNVKKKSKKKTQKKKSSNIRVVNENGKWVTKYVDNIGIDKYLSFKVLNGLIKNLRLDVAKINRQNIGRDVSFKYLRDYIKLLSSDIKKHKKIVLKYKKAHKEIFKRLNINSKKLKNNYIRLRKKINKQSVKSQKKYQRKIKSRNIR